MHESSDSAYMSDKAWTGVDRSADIDFKSLFNQLKTKNYDGILVVEVKDPQAVIESLDFIKNELKI